MRYRPPQCCFGYGSGMQPLELACLNGGQVIAVDYYVPYLKEVQQRADHTRLAHQIALDNYSVDTLAFAAGTSAIIVRAGNLPHRLRAGARNLLSAAQAVWLLRSIQPDQVC